MALLESLFISTCILSQVLLVGASDKGLLLDINPTMIKSGITNFLEVNCSFSMDKSSAMVSLSSLFISRSNNSMTDFEELASINRLTSHKVSLLTSEPVTTEGDMMPKGDSFLHMRWEYPSDFKDGYYRCLSQGQDAVGHNVVSSHIVLVSKSTPSQNDILEKLRDLSNHLIKAESQISQMGNQINDLTQKVEQSEQFETDVRDRYNSSKQALFYPPLVYGGSLYYLSKYSEDNMVVGQAICSVYGGYLAQIDDENEFNAIQSLLDNTTYGQWVLVSGNDQQQEDTWVYQSNNEPVTFFKWVGSEPNSGTAYNCLALWRNHKWSMLDFPCLDSPYKAPFLCEVPI